jgi:hypothetical protein
MLPYQRLSAMTERLLTGHTAAERVGAGIGWPSARIAAIQPCMASTPLGDRFLDRLPVRHAAREIGKIDQVAAALVLGQRPDVKR